ncbi:hypothetical protein EDD85DRAFT_958586 [Armillaria nabsnona]|nr:hypothetical protein EDD85DRAFT_958586 [Armillaria nabsnona]
MTGASGGLVHVGFMFPHPETGGYMNLGAGGSGQGSGHMGMVMGTIVAPSSRPLTPKKAWSSSSSFVVGIPSFILPSSLISPALQCAPSTLSCSNSSPLDTPRAPHQIIASPTPIVVVVVARLALCTPFHAKMAADIKTPDILHTLMVCRSHGWRRLSPMSMWAM